MASRKSRPPRSLEQRAIALLARREYSRHELAARLSAGATVDRDELERVLDQLERAGYLSDARFASLLVRQKAGSFSKRAIAHSLQQKGVATDASAEAMAQLSGTDDVATAFSLWQRRFGSPPADEREKARHVRFLLSRGYSHSVAFRVLRQAGARPPNDDEG